MCVFFVFLDYVNRYYSPHFIQTYLSRYMVCLTFLFSIQWDKMSIIHKFSVEQVPEAVWHQLQAMPVINRLPI